MLRDSRWLKVLKLLRCSKHESETFRVIQENPWKCCKIFQRLPVWVCLRCLEQGPDPGVSSKISAPQKAGPDPDSWVYQTCRGLPGQGFPTPTVQRLQERSTWFWLNVGQMMNDSQTAAVVFINSITDIRAGCALYPLPAFPPLTFHVVYYPDAPVTRRFSH